MIKFNSRLLCIKVIIYDHTLRPKGMNFFFFVVILKNKFRRSLIIKIIVLKQSINVYG
jgi:hypothetical protein